jgi:hypothetical protein
MASDLRDSEIGSPQNLHFRDPRFAIPKAYPRKEKRPAERGSDGARAGGDKAAERNYRANRKFLGLIGQPLPQTAVIT